MDLKPQSKDEAITDLLKLARENYFREYIPFDEQLVSVLKEKERAMQNSKLYCSKISDSKIKKQYTQELVNLKNNLKACSGFLISENELQVFITPAKKNITSKASPYCL